MLPTRHLVEFLLLSYALVIVPGPNVLFVISRSLQLGRLAGVTAVVGGQLGMYAQVIAVALGVGAVVEASAAVFTVIRLAGAAYLVFLGVKAIRHRASVAAALTSPLRQASTARMLRDGFVVGTARTWFARSPRRLEYVGGTSGLVMIGIGASLALTGGRD